MICAGPNWAFRILANQRIEDEASCGFDQIVNLFYYLFRKLREETPVDTFAGSAESSCSSSDSPSNLLQHHIPVHRARTTVGFEGVNHVGTV